MTTIRELLDWIAACRNQNAAGSPPRNLRLTQVEFDSIYREFVATLRDCNGAKFPDTPTERRAVFCGVEVTADT